MRRLDQLLASLGYGSRRDVRSWVEEGRITIKGVVADDPGTRAEPSDVRIDGEPPDHPGELVILMNKPAGLVCSHDSAEGPSVYGLLPERWRRRNPPVTTVGRLDKDTTGLLLLTDVGGAVHRLTSPRHKVAKVYRARLDREPPGTLVGLFAGGALILDGEDAPCAPAGLRLLGGCTVEVVLTEGRYHQVKRMFASQGYSVLELDRIRFGSLEVGNLPRGSWKELPVSILDNI